MSFAAFPALAQPALRFSLKPESLSFADCVAQPGNIPIPLAATNTNLEIVNWSAAPTPTSQPGEFVLRFKTPVPMATVIAYEPGEIFCSVSNQWKRLSAGADAERKLQVIPFPVGEAVEAIRFVVPALREPSATAASPSFRATLPFVTLIPLRMLNVAGDAMVTASSSGSTNSPQMLVDGAVDRRRNFSTARRSTPTSLESPDWVTITWPEPRTFRGILMLLGDEDAGYGRLRVETLPDNGSTASNTAATHWLPALTRATAPGQFRLNHFVVSRDPLTARALRLASVGDSDQIGLGEVLVLSQMGPTNVLDQAKRADGKTWTIPRVATRQIKVDGADNDWPAGRTNGFALACDDERLHLLYQARGADAAFANAGTNVNDLFHTGDALDLMLQTRADVDPKRTEPAPGDVRLIFTVFNGKPVCVLYDYRVEDLLVLPVVFKSAGREVSCEQITLLPSAEMNVNRNGDALTIEASVPLAAFHLDSKNLNETRGDVGRISRTSDGSTAARHVRWSNQSIGVVSDIAEAANPQPQSWGVFRFEPGAVK